MFYFRKQQGSHISAENQDGGYDSAVSKIRDKLSLGRLSSSEHLLQDWCSTQPNQSVKSLQPPNVPFWDAAPASSNMAGKPCQRQSLGTVCNWGWIQQGKLLGWIRNFSVSMVNLNYHLSPGSSHLRNLTGVSGGRHISLPPPFLWDLSVNKEIWAAHILEQSPWRGWGVLSQHCMLRNSRQVLQVIIKCKGWVCVFTLHGSGNSEQFFFLATASSSFLTANLPLAKFHNLLAPSYVKGLQKKNDWNLFIMGSIRQL